MAAHTDHSRLQMAYSDSPEWSDVYTGKEAVTPNYKGPREITYRDLGPLPDGALTADNDTGTVRRQILGLRRTTF